MFLEPPTPEGGGGVRSLPEEPVTPGGGSQDAVFLGKIIAAATRQDSRVVEDLTTERDPNDQLRSLVKAAGQGEPLQEVEPDESALRAALAARKASRFFGM